MATGELPQPLMLMWYAVLPTFLRVLCQRLMQLPKTIIDSLHPAQVLLNTCAIREKAEQKVFSRLGELRAMRSGASLERCFAQHIFCVLLFSSCKISSKRP